MTNGLARDQKFERREKLAAAGQRLPSEGELLRGMAFFRGSLAEDIAEFAERLARRLRKHLMPDLVPLIGCLEELTVAQSKEGVAAVEEALDALEADPPFGIEGKRLRCLVYRAHYGEAHAAAALSAEIAVIALHDLEESKDHRLLWSSLGWLVLSRDLVRLQRLGISRSRSAGLQKDYELESHGRQFETALRHALPQDQDREEEKKRGPAPASEPSAKISERPAAAAKVPEGSGVVVLAEVGNASVSQGKQVLREFEKIIGRPLPLPAMPDLAAVRVSLLAEFPYAVAVVDQMLKGLVARPHVHLRPTILLGPPGCGKSRFARRLSEALGVPHELIPCGGMSDSSLGGTPRRWSSGEPSLPISLVRRHQSAGPVIILDEIEKVGTERHNGNVHDVLLGFLERETSSRWHDPYIQSRCDLSHVSWLMTANGLEPIPTVLRDRCTVIRFPEPGPEHLPALAVSIMERVYAELGHDVRWVTALEVFELEAVALAWGGGSIRRLQRVLEQLVDARERQRSRQ